MFMTSPPLFEQLPYVERRVSMLQIRQSTLFLLIYMPINTKLLQSIKVRDDHGP
jgi:hypothetical protein